MTLETRESVEHVVHRYKQLGKLLNNRPPGTIVSSQFDAVHELPSHVDTGKDTRAQVAPVKKTVALPVSENVTQVSLVQRASTSNISPVTPHSAPTESREVVERDCVGTVEFNADYIVAVLRT